MVLRVAGYLRVSTAGQVADGQGLDIQREAITALIAATEGATLAGWYVDAGLSGRDDLSVRDGLADAINAVRAGEADAIAVWRLDRLARDFVLQETLLAAVWELDGAVLSCDPSEAEVLRPGVDADPTRVLVRQILGAVAQHERAMIRLRLTAGRRRALSMGKRGGGPIPYGWRQGPDGLVPDEAEARVVSIARAHRREGLTLDAIAVRLNELGVEPRRGDEWNSGSVGRMLKSWERETRRSG